MNSLNLRNFKEQILSFSFDFYFLNWKMFINLKKIDIRKSKSFKFCQKLKQIASSFVMDSLWLSVKFIAVENGQKWIILQKYTTNYSHYLTKLRFATIVPKLF